MFGYSERILSQTLVGAKSHLVRTQTNARLHLGERTLSVKTSAVTSLWRALEATTSSQNKVAAKQNPIPY